MFVVYICWYSSVEKCFCQVSYSVSGDGGYVADVSYTGEAQYPPEPAGGYGRK